MISCIYIIIITVYKTYLCNLAIIIFEYVLLPDVKLSEDGVNVVETFMDNVRLQLCAQNVHLFLLQVDILKQVFGSLFFKTFPKYALLSTVQFCRWCSSLGDDSYYRRPGHDAVQLYDLLVAQCRQQSPSGEVSACQLRRQKNPHDWRNTNFSYRMEKDRPL